MFTIEPTLQAHFAEVDRLTGCLNLVSFAKGIDENFGNQSLAPLTLIQIDVLQLRQVNRQRGFDFGDQLLRWLGIILREEMGDVVYRVSGDVFVVGLAGGAQAEHDRKARELFERLNQRAQQLDLETPVVTMAVIHFPEGKPLSTALAWKNLNEVLYRLNAEQPIDFFEAQPLLEEAQETTRAIELMAERIVSLGYMLNFTFKIAYTDPVSNLPNLIAVQRKLDLILAESSSKTAQFSLLMIDGDAMKRYNNVSYAEGDKMITQVSEVLKNAIRPGDFVGRWRFGDEFIIILPGTNTEEAVRIGDRVRSSVWKASEEWLFPTTVSVGVVHFPQHGSTSDELLGKAELALTAAKAAGKNRTVLA